MAARRLGRLKAGQIAKLGPGRYADGGGLYLNVTAGGSRAWIFRYRTGGRLRDHGLGPTYTVSLSMARKAALDCRRARYAGIDPIDERREKRQGEKLEAARAITFAQAAEQYIAANRAGWRNGRSEQQWRQSLTDYVFPLFGDLPVPAIDTALVIKVLEPLWSTKTETASRVRGRIESVLDWATTREYRAGDNPARWKGHLENLLPKKSKVRQAKHHPALPYAEIGSFMAALRQQDGIAARALELAILTTTRTKETLGARWDEINPNDKVWTIPEERMKAHKEHKVPLSDAAMALLEQMAAVRVSDFVFPGTQLGRPIGPMALQQALQRMRRDNVTPHGFRSSFRDWAAERTAFPAEIAEMALAHQVGNAVERAYRRGELMVKRRQLLAAWAAYCAAPATAADVVPLHKRRVR
jgi:integrase